MRDQDLRGERTSLFFAFALAGTLLAACSSHSSAPDSGTDAGTDAGIDAGTDAGSDAGSNGLAPLPYGNNNNGLVGNLNYLIDSDCQPLQNPSAKMTFTTPMNADAHGFDFQFNANSLATAANPHGATLSGQPSHMGWQQYIINVRAGSVANTTEVSGFIEPWPSGDPGVSNGSDLVNTGSTPFYLATLTQTPTPNLPAATTLSITLETDPATLAVTSLNFAISLPAGTPTNPAAHANYYNGVSIPLWAWIAMAHCAETRPRTSRRIPGFVPATAAQVKWSRKI